MASNFVLKAIHAISNSSSQRMGIIFFLDQNHIAFDDRDRSTYNVQFFTECLTLRPKRISRRDRNDRFQTVDTHCK